MSATIGFGCVNTHAGKFSHIVIRADPNGPFFDNSTDIATATLATDTVHSLNWEAVKVNRVGDDKLIVRLKAKARTTRPTAAGDPDSGQITVTITSPSDSPSGNVNYTNDPNA